MCNSMLKSCFWCYCCFFWSTAVGTCEEITVKSCANAGYKLTAKFGTQFQKSKGKLLDVMLPLLQHCSPHSSLILCSLFLPKCIPGIGRPMLPCRQVCLDFAKKCVQELQLASTAGMTTALCDLLPAYDGTPNKCILPSGFKPSFANSSKSNSNLVAPSLCNENIW